MAPQLSGSALYLSKDGDLNGLYSVNLTTAAVTNVGVSGAQQGNVGLAPGAGGSLIGSTQSSLLEINTDGSGTNALGEVITQGLAYNPSLNILYGVLNGDFFSINATTGNKIANLTAPTGETEALAYGNGRVYALVPQAESASIRLQSYDPLTDQWTDIGNSGLAATSNSHGLAYDPTSNLLYALTNSGQLFSIDPTEGGSSLIGDTGLASGGGLAFLPGTAPVAIASEADASFTIDLLEGASDSAGGQLSVSNLVPAQGDAKGITVNGNSLSVDPKAYSSLAVGDREVITYSYDIIDGNGGSITQTAKVTITGVNDEPTIGTPATAAIAENTTAVTTVAATDPNGDNPVYSIIGGADQALFSIDENGGGLSFITAPDFEAALDVGADNVYDVTVAAADGNGSQATQQIAITVTDEREAIVVGEAIPAQQATQGSPFSFDIPATAFNDPDNEALTYTAEVQFEGGEAGATLTGYWLNLVGNRFSGTPGNGDVGNIELQVTATDTDGLSAVQLFSLAIANINDPPSLDAPATVSVAENTTDVTLLTAADLDGDELSFSISGGDDAALFSIDETSGALSFKNAPDFETPLDTGADNSYSVAVSVEDSNGGQTTEQLSVTVTDDSELSIGEVLIDGTPLENATLTANTTNLSNGQELVTVQYQWQYFFDEGGETGWLDIDNATEASFIPDDAQVGSPVRVVVNYSEGGEVGEVAYSEETATILNVNDAPTANITIASNAFVGTGLTLDSSSDLADADGLGTLAYQWQVGSNNSWSGIANATSRQFIPSANEVDQQIRLQIRYTDGQQTEEVVYSNAATVNRSKTPAAIAWDTQSSIVSVFSLNATTATARTAPIGRTIEDTNWQLQTTGDLNGDGQDDVILRHLGVGQNLGWLMAPGGSRIQAEITVGRDVPDPNWSIVGVSDLNADGHEDIILRNQTADQIVAWYMDANGNIVTESLVGRSFGDNNWQVVATEDFNGDGKADLLLRHQAAGQTLLWEMDGETILAESLLGRVVDSNWYVEGARDFDQNGTTDVLMRNRNAGLGLLWSMANKTEIASETIIAGVPDGNSQLVF